MISGFEIISLFRLMRANSLDVIVLRNLGGELPYLLSDGKDIDILVRDNGRVENFLLNHGFVKLRHPCEKNIFLYELKPFTYFYNDKSKIYLDLHYQLCCRSLNAGEWIPLDIQIQTSAWLNKLEIQIGELIYESLENVDELIGLITRCIFDKKQFTDLYKARIHELMQLVSHDRLKKKLELIFFKFYPILLKKLHKSEFD